VPSNDSFLLSYSDLAPFLGLYDGDEVVLDEEAVNSSIENIFGTSVGERWWFPDFGSHLRSYLFRPMNDTTAELIHTEVITIINLWDPRVSVVDCTVVPSYDAQVYEVSLSWKFKNRAQLGNLSFSLRRYASVPSQPVPVYVQPPEIVVPPTIAITVEAQCFLAAEYVDSAGGPAIPLEQGASGRMYFRLTNVGPNTTYVRMPELMPNIEFPLSWSDVMVPLPSGGSVTVYADYTVTGPGPYSFPLGSCIGDLVVPELETPPPGDYLIQEDSFYLLQENGDFLLIENDTAVAFKTEDGLDLTTEDGDLFLPEGA
jgi:phage baseplate assembly protein W